MAFLWNSFLPVKTSDEIEKWPLKQIYLNSLYTSLVLESLKNQAVHWRKALGIIMKLI